MWLGKVEVDLKDMLVFMDIGLLVGFDGRIEKIWIGYVKIRNRLWCCWIWIS